MVTRVQNVSNLPTATERPTRPRSRPGRLRVLHVINYLGRGGTEYGVWKLVTGLDQELFDHLICTTRGFEPDFANELEVGDRLFVAGRPERTLQFPLFRLARIMRLCKPHIVHSRNWGAIEAVPAARLAGVPIVIHSEHGYDLKMLTGLPFRRRIIRRATYALARGEDPRALLSTMPAGSRFAARARHMAGLVALGWRAVAERVAGLPPVLAWGRALADTAPDDLELRTLVRDALRGRRREVA